MRLLLHKVSTNAIEDIDVESIGIYHRTGDALAKRESPEAHWSAAVNYYKAARIKRLKNDSTDNKIAKKAIDQLQQLKSLSSVAVRKMLDKIETEWASQILPESLQNVNAPNLESMLQQQKTENKTLSLKAIQISSTKYKSEKNINIDLIRKVGIDKQEQVLIHAEVESLKPGEMRQLKTDTKLAIHTKDDYSLRLSTTGFMGSRFYNSDYAQTSIDYGFAKLASCFKSTDEVKIEATLDDNIGYTLELTELKLGEKPGRALKNALGYCVVHVGDSDSHLVDLHQGEKDAIRWGVNVVNPSVDGFTDLQGFPALIQVSKNEAVSINIYTSEAMNSVPTFTRIKTGMEDSYVVRNNELSNSFKNWFARRESKHLCAFKIEDLSNLAALSLKHKYAVLRNVDNDILKLRLIEHKTSLNLEEAK